MKYINSLKNIARYLNILMITAVVIAGLTSSLDSQAQQSSTVSGLVTAASDGTALPGLSIIVKGTTIGTVTTFEGKYSIEVPDDNAPGKGCKPILTFTIANPI